VGRAASIRLGIVKAYTTHASAKNSTELLDDDGQMLGEQNHESAPPPGANGAGGWFDAPRLCAKLCITSERHWHRVDQA
jgi:adenylosuccinate synthase